MIGEPGGREFGPFHKVSEVTREVFSKVEGKNAEQLAEELSTAFTAVGIEIVTPFKLKQIEGAPVATFQVVQGEVSDKSTLAGWDMAGERFSEGIHVE